MVAAFAWPAMNHLLHGILAHSLLAQPCMLGSHMHMCMRSAVLSPSFLLCCTSLQPQSQRYMQAPDKEKEVRELLDASAADMADTFHELLAVSEQITDYEPESEPGMQGDVEDEYGVAVDLDEDDEDAGPGTNGTFRRNTENWGEMTPHPPPPPPPPFSPHAKSMAVLSSSTLASCTSARKSDMHTACHVHACGGTFGKR